MMKHTFKRITVLMLCGCMLATSGCASQTESAPVESIELLEPVGVALNFEKATKRTIYDEKVFSAMVCAYTEEYSLNQGMTFQAFDAYPGEQIKKGEALLHSYTENIDKQIEDEEKYIAQMEKDYQEFLEDCAEEYKDPKEEYDLYKKAVENMEKVKPEEMITEADPDTGEMVEKPNPQYIEWNAEFKRYDGRYRNATLSLDRLEQKKKEREELYNLDHDYQKLLLKRLRQEKLKSGLVSEMDGTVTNIRFLSEGNWMNEEVSLMAVADTNRKEIRCEYVNKGTVGKAKDVYALIDGKRVEVEYQPMESDEYKRLEEKNGKVYSTFHILGNTDNITLGSYAVIVLVNNVHKDVLTVPKDAVNKDDTTSYVYLVDGSESIYTPVKTGVSDGGYIEIVAGLEEGDKVLTGQAAVSASKTLKLEKGEIHYSFKESGFSYYPSAELVKNPIKYGTCYFVEKYVSQNQQVKQGDVLAKIRVVPDSIELQRKEQQLAREKERLEDLRKEDEEKNRKAIAAKEENIAELEKIIKEMRADFATTEIKAPVNGIITGYREYEEETLLQKDASLFWIADETTSYVFVQDENSLLSYGNTVTITYEDADRKQQKMEGWVVSSNPMSVGKELTTGNEMNIGWNTYVSGSLVMVSPDDVGKLAGSAQDDRGWWSRGFYTIEAQTRKMDQVVLVPRKAVKEIGGTTYVKVKQADGEVVYRSFVPGGSDTSNYWVVDGLTEGMEICIE